MDIVCHVITKLELGGAQEVALYTVSHLDRKQFRPILITGPGGLLDEAAQRIPDLEVITLPELGRRIHVVGDLMTLVRLILLFRRYRPKIVHTHSSKAGILGRWAAWCAGVPVIIHTIHGYGITPAQSPGVQRFLMLLERVTGWITTHCVSVAEADIERGRQWGFFKKNVSLIRPGIDPRPFHGHVGRETRERIRHEFGAGPNTWLIGTVACLKPQKAPGDFIAVAKQVCEIIPHAKFVLIGDGELRPMVESLMEQLQLQNRVYLAGWRRDVPACLSAMDAFVLTSRWEGLPRAILEARAAGLPIVATKVGGVEEAIMDYRDGTLVEAGAVDALSAALLRLHQRENGSPSGKSRWVKPLPKEFHIEEMVKEYEALYCELLEGSREKPLPQAFRFIR